MDEKRTDDVIGVDHYSTDPLPADSRHAAWSGRSWPSIAAVFSSRAIGEFSTAADRVAFDGMIVQYANGTARDFTRTIEQAQGDGIDVLGVGVLLDGDARGKARGRAFAAGPGALLLLDMAQPAAFSLTTSRSIQLAIPRAVADEHFGSVRKLHGEVVEADRAAMLVSNLLQIRDALPDLTTRHEPRLARTVLDMLAIALDQAAESPREAPSERGAPSLAAARQEIESRLGLPSLTIAMLCQRLNVSRSTLYRMFEPEGGVEAYIRKRRLEQVRIALLDPASTDRIGDLAYRWGFSDASHLSRQFRELYGVTPTALRASRDLDVAA